MVERIGQGTVRSANEIGLHELMQRRIVRAAKFLTPATPQELLSTNSEAGKSEAFCGGQGLVGRQLPAGPCWDLVTGFWGTGQNKPTAG